MTLGYILISQPKDDSCQSVRQKSKQILTMLTNTKKRLILSVIKLGNTEEKSQTSTAQPTSDMTHFGRLMMLGIAFFIFFIVCLHFEVKVCFLLTFKDLVPFTWTCNSFTLHCNLIPGHQQKKL